MKSGTNRLLSSPHLSPGWRRVTIIGALLTLALVLCACQTAEPETIVETVIQEVEVEVTRIVELEPETVVETVIQEVEVEVEVTRIVEVEKEPAGEAETVPAADQSVIAAAWAASPHGNTYDLGKGPNTYCSRCHSPQNWDPASTTDKPPNCVTCKFDSDDEIRMASTMDFVEEADWVGIDCATCHRVENGVAQDGLAWLNPLTREHEAVTTPNELCTKCHLTSKGVSATGGRGVEHEIILGGSAHRNWAGILDTERRPEYCSECHDPHTQQPKQCIECHSDVMDLENHMLGTVEMHEKVSCQACHDASGADVGPHPDEEMDGIWTTILYGVSRSGEQTVEAITSHSTQWQVSCDRCHFDENPWDLSVLTADGEPPAED